MGIADPEYYRKPLNSIDASRNSPLCREMPHIDTAQAINSAARGCAILRLCAQSDP